jgi:Rieske 2Fe-2S family protein
MTTFLSAAEIGTGGAKSLPGAYFTSPEIFASEQQAVFSRHWLCATRADALRQPGDFVLRNMGHESVILLRDQRGTARAYHNVCRHRGARLCVDPCGTLPRTLRCPYHAWTWGLDGALLAAPTMDELAGFDRTDYPLLEAGLAEWAGYLFLTFGEPAAPFAQAFAPVLTRFDRYNLAELRSASKIEYDVAANWKLIFENYSECYHCPTVHPQLIKLSPADSGANDLGAGPFLGGYMQVPRPGGSMTSSGQACARAVGALPAEDLQRVYYYTIFPNMLLSLHHDFVMVHTLWPESPGRTRIECEWLFHPEAAAAPGYDPEDGVGFWDHTNRQDWAICERTQLGVSSAAYVPGPYSPRDSISAAFDAEYLRVMREAGHEF